LGKKCKKNALFLLIIWWFREKVVPLHAFSRRVDMRVYMGREIVMEKSETKRLN